MFIFMFAVLDNALSMSPAHNGVELKRDSENPNDTEMASPSPKPTDQDRDGNYTTNHIYHKS